MSYINVVQKVAKDFSTVNTKIQELIAESGVESDEVKFLEIVTFGASQFLCVLGYAMMREIRSLSTKTGLSLTTVRRFRSKRVLSPILGLGNTLVRRFRSKRAMSTSIGEVLIIKNLIKKNPRSVLIGLTSSRAALKNGVTAGD